MYFLKDIVERKKAYLHNDDVKNIHVPQYKNLTLEHVLDFASQQPRIDQYLPDQPDLQKVPKQWIVNICAAVIGADFKEWVAEQVEERNAVMAQQKEVMISMDPVMAAKFTASTHVSRKCDLSRSSLSSLFLYSLQGHFREHAQDEQQAPPHAQADPEGEARQGAGKRRDTGKACLV